MGVCPFEFCLINTPISFQEAFRLFLHKLKCWQKYFLTYIFKPVKFNGILFIFSHFSWVIRKKCVLHIVCLVLPLVNQGLVANFCFFSVANKSIVLAVISRRSLQSLYIAFHSVDCINILQKRTFFKLMPFYWLLHLKMSIFINLQSILHHHESRTGAATSTTFALRSSMRSRAIDWTCS